MSRDSQGRQWHGGWRHLITSPENYVFVLLVSFVFVRVFVISPTISLRLW